MGTDEAELAAVREAVIEAGERLYKERLKALFVPGHVGEFLAIDPVTGWYFLGDTSASAVGAAHDAMPEARFYLKQIGYTAAHYLGVSPCREE
jgi:hypothetical protein